jgi:hypothetical protein
MKYIERILAFAEKIKDEVDIETKGEKKLQIFLNKTINDDNYIKKRIDDYENNDSITLNSENVYTTFLNFFSLKWSRPEKKTREGYLSGGFKFNGLIDIYGVETKFWEKSVKEFIKYEDEKHIDFELLEQLRWIESPSSAHQSVDAEYTPFFGCVKLKDSNLPSDFYYYDCGIIYKLPFSSYDDYVEALLNSSAVKCWQYFYINPQEIIDKNKGLKYITWANYDLTNLDDSITGLAYNENSKYDRLDLISEYLERCVRLLPITFPFINFNHHIDYYQQFNELYLASKGK